MNLLISGICGFAGSTIAAALREAAPELEIAGFDNFVRPGSETNRSKLQALGVRVFHADLRVASDVTALPASDWVLDAAALPSVLAGADGHSSSLQLMEHNLIGTIHLLEKCRAERAGFILLSTSRVYAIEPLAHLPIDVLGNAFVPATNEPLPQGMSSAGIDETFSTAAPISLYGATKLASETLALEYGATFDLPVWINRCGVLAGAGQFGRPDQGIFAYWINSWLRRAPLRYIGFGGHGHQVRDCLHPRDLVPLLAKQISAGKTDAQPRLINVSGGKSSAYSLRQLSEWCKKRFGPHAVTSDPTPRLFDLPWVVLDSTKARDAWDWLPQISAQAIFEEIATHAEANPDWLRISAP